jgi:hypothetical protein
MTHKLHFRFQLSLLSNQASNKVGNEPNPHRFGNLWQRIDIYLFFHSFYSLFSWPFWSNNFLSIIFLRKIQYQSNIDSGSHFDSKIYAYDVFCFLRPDSFQNQRIKSLQIKLITKLIGDFLTTYLPGFFVGILRKKKNHPPQTAKKWLKRSKPF